MAAKTGGNSGQFKPGDPKKGGRKKGTPNKTTALLKDAILKAAEQAGNKVGDEGMISYLVQQAEENPQSFMGLLGKVLPLQLAGHDGQALIIKATIGGDDSNG